MLGLSSDIDASACQWWLWLSEEIAFSRPAMEQTRLGTVRPKWVSLPPVSCSPLSPVPPEESYSWLCHPRALLACLAFIRENPNLDQQSGSSIPAAAPPWTPMEPGPFAHALSSRNSLIPSSSPGSTSSFKTAFRCFHLRKGKFIVPSPVSLSTLSWPGEEHCWVFVTYLLMCVLLPPQPAWGQESLIIRLCLGHCQCSKKVC